MVVYKSTNMIGKKTESVSVLQLYIYSSTLNWMKTSRGLLLGAYICFKGYIIVFVLLYLWRLGYIVLLHLFRLSLFSKLGK
jgi:hypothetical protein